MSIIIFYEHSSREYQASKILTKDLTNRGFSVSLFSLHFELKNAIRFAKRTNVEAVIIPYEYKKSSINYLQPFIANKKIPYIINLHHEETAAPFDEHTLLPIDDISKNRVIHFVWTDVFKDKLISIGVNPKLIYITGNIRLDLITQIEIPYSRDQYGKKYGLDINKKWILYCESGSEVYTSKQIEDMISRKKYEKNLLKQRNELIERALEISSKEIYNLSDSFFENFEFIFRPHPGKLVPDLIKQSRVHIISESSVYEWFKYAYLCVSRTSTTLFEAELSNVNSVRYDPVDYPKELLPRGIENYPVVKTLEELTKLDYHATNLKTEKVYIKYIGDAENNISKVSETISQIIKNGNVGFDTTPFIVASNWYVVRKILSNYWAQITYLLSPKGAKILSGSVRLFFNDVPEKWKKVG